MTRDRQVNIRISDEEYAKLKNVAERTDRTVSSLIRIIVTNELKKTDEDRISASSP